MLEQFKVLWRTTKRLRKYFIATSFLSLMLWFLSLLLFQPDYRSALMIIQTAALVLLCTISFIEANTLGMKDRHRKVPKALFRGFTLGFVGQFPIWLFAVCLSLLVNMLIGYPFATVFINYIGTLPVLQFTSVLNYHYYSFWGYVASIFIIPVVCELGYLLSFLNIDINDKLGGIHKDTR